MSTALIQFTGKRRYSPIENKHKKIQWLQSENFLNDTEETILGQIGRITYFAIDQHPGGYIVRHFANRTVEFHGWEKPYKSLSTAKALCTRLLRKEILNIVIMLDNLADIRNIE